MNTNPTGQTQLSVMLNEYECRKGVAARFAAGQMDWTQVALNGGPPCFHICDDQHFCGRAERWDGHGEPGFHDFVSLADLIVSARADNAALVKALRRALITAKIMPAAAYERITDNFKVDMLANDMQADYDTMEQEITAILTNSSTAPSVPEQGLGE